MSSVDAFPDHVRGYPKIAAKVEILPEISIYRRFGALNARNLLYYQAELAYLEAKLQEREKLDSQDDNGNRKKYAHNWYWLEHSNDGEGSQLSIVKRIRELLALYNEALIQYNTVIHYSEPGKYDLHLLQDYLASLTKTDVSTGHLVVDSPLHGRDGYIWGAECDRESYATDLITLKPRAKKDIVSNWAAERMISGLKRFGCVRFMKPSKVHGTVGYEDTTIYRITYWFTNILASIIPIASIAILYHVQSMSARIGIIAVFNILVSVCMMALANAKRAEIFAVTAGFAAVQVVFITIDKNTCT